MMGRSIGASPGAEVSAQLIHHLILFYSLLSASLHTAAVLFIAPSCSFGVLPASSPLWPRSLGASSPGQGGGMDAVPGVPTAVQQEESTGCGGRQIIKP